MGKIQDVPFFSLKEQSASVKQEVLEKIASIIDQNEFVLGQELKAFEDNFAAYCESNYTIGLTNGTAALYVALRTLGIGPDDEVIIPSATYTATALAIVQLGAKPVFADINPHTWTIDEQDLARKITHKTKAVIVVHLYGNPCKMEALTAVCTQHKLLLLEDAAQAHGSMYAGKKIGSFGDIACFSFYPSKNLGAMGDAGAITFQNEDYLELASAIRNCGKDKQGNHQFLGFNYRMDPFQSAVLNVKLPFIESFNAKRRAIAERYKKGISNNKITWQKEQENAQAVYHLFVLKVDNRQAFTDYLKECKIGFAFHYLLPTHLQPAYSFLNYQKGDLPITEDLFERCVSIPMYPEMTLEAVQRVIEVLNAY